MTVICVRDGMMAADTAQYADEVITGHTQKVRRAKNGIIYAVCGASSCAEQFSQWINSDFRLNKTPPEMAEGYAGAVVLTPDNKIFGFNHRWHQYELSGEFYAQGSHIPFLMGAMAAGASANEAVELAIIHCIYAGGRAQWIDISGRTSFGSQFD